MTYMLVRVDGKKVIDDNLGKWQRKPPSMIRDMVRPGAKPQPWMKAMLIAMAEATMLEQPTSIDVKTSPTGWIINVENLGTP